MKNTCKAEEKESKLGYIHTTLTQNRDANRSNTKPVSRPAYTKLVRDTVWNRVILGQSPPGDLHSGNLGHRDLLVDLILLHFASLCFADIVFFTS